MGSVNLSGHPLMAFVPVTDLDRAMHFYADVLGLPVMSAHPDFCELNANGTSLRLTLVLEKVAMANTIVGWQVDDIDVVSIQLLDRGANFQWYQGIQQDDKGIWTSPTGDRVAWFEDPDGNVLSLTQFLGQQQDLNSTP